MEIDKYISELVSQQFPDFYHAEGPNFIAFVQAYYEWMEQEGYTINASKSLLDYKDIDNTIDDFVDNFRYEFLAKFPAITAADQRFVIKHIQDFYKSKGTVRGMKLFFRLLYGDDIEVYDPSKDILKASDGVWTLPRYIEVEHNDRTKNFIYKKITGSVSGATAFVESVITKSVNNRLIDVIFLSDIFGNFVYNELVTEDDNLYDAPRILGSLTSIQVVDGGANNKIGDVFEVGTSTNGTKGKVRVTGVTDGTGRVDFKLITGGTGYTTANGQVRVSNTVLSTSNKTNSNGTPDYNIFEVLRQPLYSLTYNTISGNTDNLYHSFMNVYDSANTLVANGVVVDVTDLATNTFILNITEGNITNAAGLGTPGNTVSFTLDSDVDISASGVVVGSNATAVGLIDITNTFYANGVHTLSDTGVSANITAVSTGSGADWQVGSILNTENVNLFTDLIVDYANLAINTVAYGFPKDPTANLSSIMGSAWNSDTYTIGTIAAPTNVNPGTQYNTNPFVLVRNDLVAGYDRRNIVLELSNINGFFNIGDTISQNVVISSETVSYNANTGVFTLGEAVTQSNGSANAYGTINSVNSTSMVLTNVRGTFYTNTGGGTSLLGLDSAATGNVTAIANSNVIAISKGVVVDVTPSTVELQRTNFNVDFQLSSNISSSSGGSATIFNLYQNDNSLAMGNNAVLTANVSTAKGIATTVEVLNSGFGHQPNDSIELISSTNQFAITGIANVYNQGLGDGYWKNTQGMLNADKYIYDGVFFQDYSYEIQSRLSLDKYAETLKLLAHIVGTQMFGKTVIKTVKAMNVAPEPVSITFAA